MTTPSRAEEVEALAASVQAAASKSDVLIRLERCGRAAAALREYATLLRTTDAQPCPYVITANEGTSHCSLAEKDAQALERVRAAWPTNWCDPLLTGPTKVLPDGCRYTPADVERLLNSLRARIERAVGEQND